MDFDLRYFEDERKTVLSVIKDTAIFHSLLIIDMKVLSFKHVLNISQYLKVHTG